MPSTKTIVGAVIGGVVSTAVLAALSCLYLMAAAEGKDFHDTALFGGVFFSSGETEDGATTLGAGVENVVPLAVIALVLSAFYLVTASFYGQLVERKKQLTSG